jgi:PAS domain S-box-containing protein
MDPSTFISCRQWLQVLDELNVGAYTVDLNRRVLAINYSAQALMGLRENEVSGRDCREVFVGVPCMVHCLLEKDPVQGEPPPDSDLEVFDETDRRHLITRLATPVYGPDRRMAGCLTILKDHSPVADLINRVHYEVRNMKIILDNLDVGIFTVNRGGLITFFNHAAEQISGYHRDQVLGESCTTIFEGETSPDVCLLKDSIVNGRSRRTVRGRMITKDGESIPIRARYMALKNEKGRIVGGLATFHDLTLVRRLDQAIRERYTFHDMIGRSPAMQKIFDMVEVVADSEATLLIEGPTGSGKDLLAKIVHSASRRSGKPLVKVNCAAIPENLMESELFGYIRGAFTGAEKDKPGRFQLADGGTIFLDEIGDLPLGLQAKLLRVIEEREFYPLGSRSTLRVDVRILSATNRGLGRLVREGAFREDLYYRLNVMNIVLPPLSERRDDLPLLIPHLLRKLSAARSVVPPLLSEEVMDILLNYPYPGNVRELENILEHALIICRGESVRMEHLPLFLQGQPADDGVLSPSPPSPGYREQQERQDILEALRTSRGHRGRAAASLGIDRSTLWRKMKKLAIQW